MSGFAVLLAGVVLISSISWRYIGEWLLVVLAAIAVAFAADLLVINGLPEFGAKYMVLASIGLSWIDVLVPAALESPNSAMAQQLLQDRTHVGNFLGVWQFSSDCCSW